MGLGSACDNWQENRAVVGAFGKLLGLDAFNLLLGRSPGDITGAAEGLVLGAAVGLGAWIAARYSDPMPLRRSMIIAGAASRVTEAGTSSMRNPPTRVSVPLKYRSATQRARRNAIGRASSEGSARISWRVNGAIAP